jgi:uncharacterized protein YneF (UPF0154 family)
MLEIIVFAVTLVVAQCVGGYIMYKIMIKQLMNKEYLKKMSKMTYEVAMELQTEMED